MNRKLLPIYLNDHLAGSTAGLELAKRALGSNEDSEFGDVLRQLVADIADDRATLRNLMRTLGVGEDRVKVVFAWAGEKAGRLKLNGSVVSYSPLSRLLELEGLTIGIAGKRSLWLSLESALAGTAEVRDFDFPALAARAQAQLEALEPARLRAAELALAG